MSGLEFSVPFNDDRTTLAEILALNKTNGNTIREIYLGVPQEITGSGRVGVETTLERFIGIVNTVHDAGVRVDMTMNSTCEGTDWYADASVSRLVTFIKEMHEEHGVEAVTLANPFHISAVRKACPNLEISASVLADIDCYSRAKTFAEAGANVMTVDTSINRDIKLLKRIVDDLGVDIKLMVNEGCLNKCPFRKFHMNYISHRSREAAHEEADFSFACGDEIAKDPANIFRSNWVRPEELKKYQGVTSYFKIVGRDMLASKVLRCVRAYLEESYDGNLFDLLCSAVGFYGVEKAAYIDNKALGATSYFKRLSTCNRKCYQCTYCDDLVDSHLRYRRVSEENLLDMGQGEFVAAIKARFGGVFPMSNELSKTPLYQD